MQAAGAKQRSGGALGQTLLWATSATEEGPMRAMKGIAVSLAGCEP
jgi:hypothetical protein